MAYRYGPLVMYILPEVAGGYINWRQRVANKAGAAGCFSFSSDGQDGGLTPAQPFGSRFLSLSEMSNKKVPAHAHTLTRIHTHSNPGVPLHHFVKPHSSTSLMSIFSIIHL